MEGAQGRLAVLPVFGRPGCEAAGRPRQPYRSRAFCGVVCACFVIDVDTVAADPWAGGRRRRSSVHYRRLF